MFSFKIDAMHSRFFELPLSPSLCTPASYISKSLFDHFYIRIVTYTL